MKPEYFIAIYIVVINLFAYILYGVDKSKSKKEMWRISERALIIIALVGGSVGALLAMKKFHHKTKHKRFTLGVPFILIVQLLILLLFVYQLFIK